MPAISAHERLSQAQQSALTERMKIRLTRKDLLWGAWHALLAGFDASRAYCWHSWREQTASIRRLLALRFAWVLPGHGDRVGLTPDAMRGALAALVERMAADGGQ